MTQADCRRWIALSDRVALEEPLSEEELAWLPEHAEHCPHCRAEARFWSALGDVVEAPEVLEDSLEGLLRSTEEARKKRAQHARYQVWSIGLAAGVALAISTAWWLGRRPETATAAAPGFAVQLLSVAGEVKVGERAARAGESLGDTVRLRTSDGPACAAVDTTITFCLDAHGQAAWSFTDPAWLVVTLERGRLMSRLDRQLANRRYVVQTRSGSVVAKGTLFLVEANADGSMAVHLHEGRVGIRAGKDTTRDLTGPSQASIREAILLEPWSEQTVAGDRQLLTLTRLPRTGERTELDVMTRPSGAFVSVDGTVLGPSPVSVLLGSGQKLNASMPGYSPVTELLPQARGGSLRRSYELAKLPAEAAPPPEGESDSRTKHTPTAEAAPGPGALLARAQALRSEGRYRECAASYRQLIASHGRSDEARVSLVSLGELELSELGQPSQALRHFEQYLRAGGSLTREARFGRIRALRLLGRGAEVEEAAALFVRDYPGSAQAASLRHRSSPR